MIQLNDIYPAIQGEGCLAGTPMVILRTMGCSVGCPWCDTKETWKAEKPDQIVQIDKLHSTKTTWGEWEEMAIAAKALNVGPGIKWALITGGEPAEQDLIFLVDVLHVYGFQVALETSGTAIGHVGVPFDWVCVSPKIGMPGGKPILPEAVAEADEIKHVVCKQADIDTLDRFLADMEDSLKFCVQICLQPVSQSPKATDLCYRTCIERGWRLSLQLHKYLDKP